MSDALWPYLLVGVGGFIGANTRFLVATVVGRLVDTEFPLGTFVVNITGSFLLGIIGTLVLQRMTPHSNALRLALGVGFIGAYTTFSTFEFEANTLVEQNAWPVAALYVGASVALGFIAVRGGIALASMWRP